MRSEDFKRMMATFTDMMLTQEHEGFPKAEFEGFVHVVDTWMRESYEKGASGSSVPNVIEKLRTMNNPLALATADAMQWCYRQGIESRG